MPAPASSQVREEEILLFYCASRFNAICFTEKHDGRSVKTLRGNWKKTGFSFKILIKSTGYKNSQSNITSKSPVFGEAYMIKLTARQQEILNLISKSIEKTGFPPTRAEIAAELGFRSVNAAEEHLQALARKGVIEMVPGISRGIRLLQDDAGMPVSVSPAQMQYAVPLVGRVAAGSPILAQEHVENTYQLDPSLFSDKPDYLLKVRGLSMRDIGILEGDLIAVKKTEKVRNGQIVVARIGDDVTVKRFRKTGSTVELISENPDFKPIRINRESDNFRIEGLVVGLLRTWH